ncbi:hypothetical protein [Mesorhizobium sp. M0684]|uniref:hypothetical protein n=2 Tax=Mesorhizobium TaxID=68287 RepID=UPI003339B351
MEDVDVVIIGGALSGLCAMRRRRPGRSQARATLMQPVAEKIFFAGEHLAGPLMQTCGGARLSGEAVAKEVVAQLAAK